MYFSIDHSRLISAILRNVPGTYLRDYRENKGWLTICRGYKTIHDSFKDTDKLTANLPAETLANFPRGQVTAATLMDGPVVKRPGWRLQMRGLRAKISEPQARRIEKALGIRVFT